MRNLILRFGLGSLTAAVLILTATAAEAQTPPVGTESFLAQAPQIQTKPIGTYNDCVLRVPRGTPAHYCSDLRDAMASLNAYWGQEFAKLVPAGQTLRYTAPSVSYFHTNAKIEDVDCEDEKTPIQLCGSVSFTPPNRIEINELYIIYLYQAWAEFDGSRGTSSLTVPLATRWSAYAVSLLPGMDKVPQNNAFLESNCHAGGWFGSETDAGKLDGRAVAEVLRARRGDPITPASAASVTALRMGYEYGSTAACASWRTYDGKTFESTSYFFTPLPGMVLIRSDEASVSLHGYNGPLVVRESPATYNPRNLTEAFQQQLRDFLDSLGDSSRTVTGAVDVDHAPDQGSTSMQMAGRWTKPAGQKVEAHGIFYFYAYGSKTHLGIALVEEGPLAGASWDDLEDDLNFAILGLVLK